VRDSRQGRNSIQGEWRVFRETSGASSTLVEAGGIIMASNMPVESKCPYCESAEVVRAVKLSQPAETGDIGLQHRKALVFTATETLYADLCKACGSISRFYVKETNRNWITG
jgi:hypothetical protein